MKTYIHHADPGHGWVAVKRSEVIELGIYEKISSFSYQNGGTVYLEEDADGTLFVEAYREKHGEKPSIESRHTNNSSRVRTYQPFSVKHPPLKPADVLGKAVRIGSNLYKVISQISARTFRIECCETGKHYKGNLNTMRLTH